MAAELDANLNEESRLIESSGGVFEVEHEGRLIFSKKAIGRFPDQGEVLVILHGLSEGLALSEAQAQAAKGIPVPPSFQDWLASAWKRLTSR